MVAGIGELRRTDRHPRGSWQRRDINSQCTHRTKTAEMFAFAVPGDPTSALVAMRCSQCKVMKPVSTERSKSAFPPSCAVFRRGSCRKCNQARSKERYQDSPLGRKLESARVRYKTFGSLKVADVEYLYFRERVDWTNEENLRRTYLAKEDDDRPFGVGNVTLRWRERRGTEEMLAALGAIGNYVVRCN